MNNPQRIYLLGLMGAGKTYWGLRLAQALDLPFVDLDAVITSRQQQSISAIFENDGEQKFRALEQEALHSTLAYPAAVVATGGGCPCFFDNMDWMNEHGITVFLDADPALLAMRLKKDRSFRPLLADIPDHQLERHLTRLLDQRIPFYQKAQRWLKQHSDDEHFLERLIETIVN